MIWIVNPYQHASRFWISQSLWTWFMRFSLACSSGRQCLKLQRVGVKYTLTCDTDTRTTVHLAFTEVCVCAYSTTYLYDSCMCICTHIIYVYICHINSYDVIIFPKTIDREMTEMTLKLGRRKPSLVEPRGLTFIVNALGSLAGGLQISWQSVGHDTRWTNHATGQARMARISPWERSVDGTWSWNAP